MAQSALAQPPVRAAGAWRRAGSPILALVAAAAILLAVWQLERTRAGLSISRASVGTIPVTVFAPTAAGAPAPVVVIAHGFAGSQQLMIPFATTLARNGYIAVTFDFMGHGRNPEPMRGDVTKVEGTTPLLVDEVARVAAWARELPGGDGRRLAVLGHSMASDIIVRFAKAHPEVAATVAVSMFSPEVEAGSPRDLLVIVGNLEPMLKREALRVAGMASGGRPPEPGVTYGGLADGTARRVAFSPGVEHVGVLYSQDSMREALAWLDGVFGRSGSGYLDRRGPWLALLFLGLVLLARPLARLLPRVADQPEGDDPDTRTLLIAAVAPAVLTPLILWKLPLGFLPVLVGDYLAAHFALYGLLTAAAMYLLRRPDSESPFPLAYGRLAVGVAAVAAYGILAFGLPIDRYVTSFVPTGPRLPLVFAMLGGMLPYFIADEWLTRGAGRHRWRYALTKLCFLLSLAAAVALNPWELFFLVIIVPVILVFFVVYGLFSGWAYRATRHPFVGGLANALAFAWALAVTFPIVAR